LIPGETQRQPQSSLLLDDLDGVYQRIVRAVMDVDRELAICDPRPS
jgi:hypothetical protein